jgi:hypothetical protein
MSIFRNRTLDHSDISAFLDGELGPYHARRMDGHPQVDRLAGLRQTVRDASSVPEDRIAAAQHRVYQRLQRNLSWSDGDTPLRWWERTVGLPAPVVATAAIVLVILTTVVTVGALRLQEVRTVPDIAGRTEALNLQVHVDGDHADELFQWLQGQDSLDTVTIQLPQSAQFQLRGEPVLMRPGQGRSEAAADDEVEIVPLERAGE